MIEETEIPCPEFNCARDMHCPQCEGRRWIVTARKVQLGVPFDEQAAHAYIQGLHAHIRKAAQSLEDAAKDFEKLGHQKQAGACRQASKAVLQPVEGQD